ncbi:hypothetical protein ACFV0O_36705 [Kitasatospora sp. NPDC059577]|uniref:hypothetical protein n=1 Tax=unclassified Kitasatospora TaxID=2633591 RepID=UPI0036B32A6B
MRRTAWGGCAAAVVLALGAVACTGQGGDGAPPVSARPSATVQPVVLPEPASASAQWIVDELAGARRNTPRCPVPSLANLVVLGDDGGGDADAAWLADDSYVCLASITRGDAGLSTAIIGDRIGVFTAMREAKMIGVPERLSFFTLFPGDVRPVVLRGDDRALYGDLHQRVVDLGGGRAVTVVQYAYVHAVPVSGSGDGAVCPSGTDPCRDAH